MILGVGTDIVEVERILRSIERFGDAFLRRILLPEERAYCLGYRFSAPHVAARFAAKEAVGKAFGTGINADLGWLDMEVVRLDSGAPHLRLHGKGQTLLENRRGRVVHLSLSHCKEYATAVAVLEA